MRKNTIDAQWIIRHNEASNWVMVLFGMKKTVISIDNPSKRREIIYFFSDNPQPRLNNMYLFTTSVENSGTDNE